MADKGFITTGERVRNFVGVAFLISIFVHFLLAPFFPNITKQSEDQQVEKVSVSKKIVVKIPTPPPPTPTPKPTPTPPPQKTPPPQVKPQTVQPKLKVHVPKTTNNNAVASTEQQYNVTKGSENGVPAGTSTGTPAPVPATPAPTPKPACANPNQEATATQVMSPEYPQSALDLGLGPVAVLVQVTIGPTGNLVDASVYKSSGNMAIDRAAVRAARQSQYAPKLVNCQPTTGTYIFHADFTPD